MNEPLKENQEPCTIADVMYWRDIREEMPPEHENVLVRLDSDIYLLGIMDSNNQWGIYWQDGRNAEDPDRPVTHWMPILACT